MQKEKFDQSLLAIEDSLYRYAYSLVYNQDDAKDLLQETFVKALSNKDKFEDGTNLSAWTFTIMKNTFYSNYQKQRHAPFTATQANDLRVLNVADDSKLLPESEIFEQELEKGIQQIEEDQRVPFQMYNEGYKYQEIAEKLDTSIGTIKTRIYMCRRKLMDNLREFQN